MHGQSAAPSYTQQREKEGWGERRDGGAKGEVGEEEQRPLVFKSTSPNNRTSFGMLELHVLRWRMHHGVIEKKKTETFFLVFLQYWPFCRLRYSQSQR